MSIINDFPGCSWIGVPADLYKDKTWDGRLKAQVAYFRREFTLHDKGATLTMRVSAASRYRLYVNGVSLLSGPCKGDRFRHYYETIDVSKYIKWGHNIISVKVVAYPPYDAMGAEYGDGIGPECEFGTAAGPCLLVGGEVLSIDGKKMASVGTGETPWTVCLDDAIQYKTPKLSYWIGGMEHVDGAKIPKGWIDAPKPDGVWTLADVRWPVYPNGTGGIFPFHLQPRPIPLMYETPVEFTKEMPLRPADIPAFTFMGGPVTIPPHTTMAVELDAGVLTTAYVELPVSGGSDAEILIRYAECYTGETLTDKGDRADCVNFRLDGHQDIYYPSGTAELYSPLWFRTFRFVRVEVKTGEHAVTLEKPKITETGYPLEQKSTFVSPDANLNKLWEISARTLQRCMHETYEDCPYYEQLQYIMDTRLQILFTYALSGDTRMALRTIDDYHASILPEGILQSRYPCQVTQVIPVFALHWIFMLEDYYQQTGDASIPRRYRATVDNVLDWYGRHIGPMGLVGQTDYWQFTDWVEAWENRHGMSFASSVGPSTSNNLTYVLALRTAARINRLTGRNDAAAEYDTNAETILANIQKYCWNDDVKLYSEGPGVDEYGQHAQVLAVLTGLAKDPKALMSKTLEDDSLLQCSFPWMFYFIRALEEAGMYDRTSIFFDRLTGFVKLNATTVPERHFTVRSECHAWGAFPLYEFPHTFLGVRPAAPGWREIIIRPYCGLTPSCSGTVTTPVGDVQVSWERIDTTIKLSGCAPKGIPCTVEINGKREYLPNGGEFSY
ncbi:MAG: hypothetical protein FWE42_05120 [Defluviitaleaceae bacterium]|nr:hypothetical protein [Defluviitaleaceae bacterium]